MGPKRNLKETGGLSSIAPAAPDPASLQQTPGQRVPPVSAAKRQRVSRACDQCRAAREKCDGVQPQCFPCISQTRSCTYNVSPKKRGVQTGYIRTLELTLGWMFENMTGAEDALANALSREGSQAQAVVTGKDAAGATRLHKKWGRSRVHQAIDGLLSGGAAPAFDLDEPSPSVDANSTDGMADAGKNIAPEPPDAAPNSVHGPHLATLPDHVIPDTQNPRTMSQNYSPGPSLNTPIRIRLPPEHWRLLDVYFSYTHSWLPILEKQALFQTSYRYSKEGLLLASADPSSAAHAELWAVLALTSFQSTASSQSSPGDTGNTTVSHAQIYNTARGLIPSDCEAFRINHARALLLLTLINMARGNGTDASLLLGSAIRILLSLHAGEVTSAGDSMSPIRAALMSCFMLETVLSVAYNQLPHLRAEDLASFPPLPESGLDQWEPWAPCEGFGSKPADFRSSRSPSFCITTFNQLYTILLVVSQETSARRRGATTENHRSSFIAQLQQTVVSETPFGDFVASRDHQSSSVPTAYIIRILYLWATIRVSGVSSGSSISLLAETLERYEELFNTFTIPPFLLACIRSMANEDFLAAHGQQDREQLARLALRYSVSEPMNRSNSSRAASHCISMPTNQPSMEREQADRVSPGLRSVVSGSGLVPLPVTTSSLYGPGHPRRMSNTYDQQFRHPAPTGNLHGGFGSVMAYGVPNVGMDMQHAHPSIGYGGPDYDALLDDMAATDCTDSIEADPQFMLNLGYGPGCDTSEIFRNRFNGYE